MFISCDNNYSIVILKLGKLKNCYVRWDSKPQTLDLRPWNTCAIGCAKKTAENAFNYLIHRYKLLVSLEHTIF